MITLETHNVKQAERIIIKSALVKTNGNISQTAKITGIPKATLYNKLKRYFTKEELNAIIPKRAWWD